MCWGRKPPRRLAEVHLHLRSQHVSALIQQHYTDRLCRTSTLSRLSDALPNCCHAVHGHYGLVPAALQHVDEHSGHGAAQSEQYQQQHNGRCRREYQPGKPDGESTKRIHAHFLHHAPSMDHDTTGRRCSRVSCWPAALPAPLSSFCRWAFCSIASATCARWCSPHS